MNFQTGAREQCFLLTLQETSAAERCEAFSINSSKYSAKESNVSLQTCSYVSAVRGL